MIFKNGVIVNDPTSAADPVTVSVPDLTYLGRTTFGPMSFRPHITAGGTIRLPQRGDIALIAIDEQGGPEWCVDWHRADSSTASDLDDRIDALESSVAIFDTDPVHITAGSGIGQVAFPTDSFFLVRKGNPATTPFYYEITAGATAQVWEINGGVIVRGTSASWGFGQAHIRMTLPTDEVAIEVGYDGRYNFHNALNWVNVNLDPWPFTIPSNSTRRFHIQLRKYSSVGVGAEYYNSESGHTGDEGGEGPWIRARRIS